MLTTSPKRHNMLPAYRQNNSDVLEKTKPAGTSERDANTPRSARPIRVLADFALRNALTNQTVLTYSYNKNEQGNNVGRKDDIDNGDNMESTVMCLYTH